MSEWARFVELLSAESAAMRELSNAAVRLTEALVANEPEAIDAAERQLEAYRVLHGSAFVQRTAMQKRGFGELTLPQVCAYAPPALRRRLQGIAQEITVSGIGLQVSVQNNKALILAGMERLARTVAVLQRAGTEQTGTYKRRGVVPPPNGSVIVSRRA